MRFSFLLSLLVPNAVCAITMEFPELQYLNDFILMSGAVYTMDSCDDAAYNLPSHIECHSYENSLFGTEVMVLSSSSSSTSSHNRKYIAVCFAGTDSTRDEILDVDMKTTDFGPKENPIAKDIKVHAGFNKSLFGGSLYDHLFETVSTLHRQFPEYEIVLTGHSLGGADAVLLGAALSQTKEFSGTKIDVFNFGCPMIGKDDWLIYANSIQNLGIWRFVLDKDPVPRLPGGDFRHVGHTAQIKYSDDVGANAYYLHYGNESLGYAGKFCTTLCRDAQYDA